MTNQRNCSSLSAVLNTFVTELAEIEAVFAFCKGHPTVTGFKFRYTPTEDGCLVSMWDAWTRFLRNVVMTSAAGPILGSRGLLYSIATPRSEIEVLSYLQLNNSRNVFGFTNGEPKWNSVLTLDSIVQALGLPNASRIISAIGSSSISLPPVIVSNPLEEIRICRNFVAHKASPTLRGVVSFAKEPFVDLSSHLRELRYGVETFSEWKECLVVLAEAVTQ
jgi:hypothetical protein